MRVARLVSRSMLAVLLAACNGGEAGAQSGGDAPAGEVLVSAAASLTDVFAAMESAFEAAHPDVDVRLNLGGSSALREQILEGAPVDVFASADMTNVDTLVDAGAVSGTPQVFARNRLVIAVPAGNPAGVTGLDDFSREELLIGLCAARVPCGELAREALDEAGVIPATDTNEPDVRALLTKIAAGELDAGITYATDLAAAAGLVDGVSIPPTLNPVTDYTIVALAAAPNREAAGAFVEFLLSPAGRKTLADYGFVPP